MGIPTKPPTFRTIDWGALVRKEWGDDWHKPEVVYEFGKRKFFDSGSSGGPYGPEDT